MFGLCGGMPRGRAAGVVLPQEERPEQRGQRPGEIGAPIRVLGGQPPPPPVARFPFGLPFREEAKQHSPWVGVFCLLNVGCFPWYSLSRLSLIRTCVCSGVMEKLKAVGPGLRSFAQKGHGPLGAKTRACPFEYGFASKGILLWASGSL